MKGSGDLLPFLTVRNTVHSALLSLGKLKEYKKTGTLNHVCLFLFIICAVSELFSIL